MTQHASHAAAAAHPKAGDPGWIRPLLIANLVCEIGIITTGGIVRLTGSGLGCSTWPNCTPGSIVPTAHQEEGWEKYVEFGNRLLTFVLAALAIAVVYTAFTKLKNRGYAGLSVVLLLGVVVQAVVGGITVLTGLHPAMVTVHFLASAVLIAVSAALLAKYVSEGTPSPGAPKPVMWLAKLTATVFVVVLVLGTFVTGSGPHSGDANVDSRYAFDIRSMSWLHADAVMLFLGLSVGVLVAVWLTSPAREPRRAWGMVLGVSLAQGVLGYAQYALGVPELLVLLHMTLAGILTAAVAWGMVSLKPRSAVHGHAPDTHPLATVQDSR